MLEEFPMGIMQASIKCPKNVGVSYFLGMQYCIMMSVTKNPFILVPGDQGKNRGVSGLAVKLNVRETSIY